MNDPKTTTTTKIEYLYVKDLPDAGGLRSARMKQLREKIEGFKRNGALTALVRQGDGGELEYSALSVYPAGDSTKDKILADPYFREAYNLTRDLEPQFAEHRACNW